MSLQEVNSPTYQMQTQYRRVVFEVVLDLPGGPAPSCQFFAAKSLGNTSDKLGDKGESLAHAIGSPSSARSVEGRRPSGASQAISVDSAIASGSLRVKPLTGSTSTCALYHHNSSIATPRSVDAESLRKSAQYTDVYSSSKESHKVSLAVLSHVPG